MRTYWHIAKVTVTGLAVHAMVACESISRRLRVDHPGDGPTVEGALPDALTFAMLRTSRSWFIAISHKIRATDILTRKDCPRRLEMRGNCNREWKEADMI